MKEQSAFSRRHSAPSQQPGRGSRSFEDLAVWRKSHELVLSIYKATAAFPGDERYGLVSQMRRAAASVPASIAEGFRKRSSRDKVNFYNIAQGSLEELRYYVILARDLGYSPLVTEILERVDEVGRMLYALVQAIVNDSTQRKENR